MNQPGTLTCPECSADMRTYERNGVTIDQCTDCRGRFLDRGELERLVDAEGSYYDGGGATSAASPPRQHSERGDRYGHDEHSSERGRSKRKSLLSELLG